MRRLSHAAAAVLAGALCAAPSAGAATTLTIRGAGFGHGVGLSQYGALGFAQHGWTHEQILGHYYTGTALGQAPGDAVVRVLLQSASTPSFTGATSAGGRHLRAATTYRATLGAAGKVNLVSPSGRVLGSFASPLVVTSSGGPVQMVGGPHGGGYRGWLELRASAGGVAAVNAVGLEQYVAGVIGRESPSSWPLEALEAQAIAARTYAITTSKGGAEGFDQYPDTRSQVYGGVAAEGPRTNQATNGTAGQVVTYDGKPVTTYFFSTSGGRTENNENVFGGKPAPWLRSVTDPYDDVSPHHRWGPIRLTSAQAGAKLGGLVKGSFVAIHVVQRGASPRVLLADVVGTGGTTRVTGAQLRSAFGLLDSWMTFNALSADVEGYDDGVGSTPKPLPPTGVGVGGGTPAHLRMTGKASFRRPGTVVVLQRRDGGHAWHDVRHTRLGHARHFKLALRRAGLYRVRIGGALGPALRAPSPKG